LWVDEKRDQRAGARGIGPIGDAAALARFRSQDLHALGSQRGFERVLCGQPTASASAPADSPSGSFFYEQAEDREPRRLPECSQRRERMRGGHRAAAKSGADMTDHG